MNDVTRKPRPESTGISRQAPSPSQPARWFQDGMLEIVVPKKQPGARKTVAIE